MLSVVGRVSFSLLHAPRCFALSVLVAIVLHPAMLELFAGAVACLPVVLGSLPTVLVFSPVLELVAMTIVSPSLVPDCLLVFLASFPALEIPAWADSTLSVVLAISRRFSSMSQCLGYQVKPAPISQ